VYYVALATSCKIKQLRANNSVLAHQSFLSVALRYASQAF